MAAPQLQLGEVSVRQQQQRIKLVWMAHKVMLLAPKLHRAHRTGNFTKNSDAAYQVG